MAFIPLTGQITPDGELEVILLKNLPVGKVTVFIQIPEAAPDPTAQWADEELAELMMPNPMIGAEIVAAGLAGGWEHLGILDSLAWVEAQRSQRCEQNKW